MGFTGTTPEALLIKPRQAAEMIGCDNRALFRLGGEGTIRIVQAGRRSHLVDMPSVRAFLALPDAQRHKALKAAGPQREFKPRSLSVCYFIGGDHGPIKIGESVDPVKRLETFQTAHPYPLKLLATVRGGRAKEREYHQRFADHRLNGEWFERHSDVLAEIERLKSPSPTATGIAGGVV